MMTSVRKTARVCALTLSLGALALTACSSDDGDSGSDNTGGSDSGGSNSGGSDSGGSNSGGSDTGGNDSGGSDSGGAGGGDTGGSNSGGDAGMAGSGGGANEPGPVEQTFAGAFDFASELRGVDISSEGLIYASGKVAVNVGTEEAPLMDEHTVVARFTSAGALDEGFDDDGVVLLNAAPAGEADDGAESSTAVVALPGGGAIVLIGASDGEGNGGADALLARLDGEGELVETFGTDGIAHVVLTDWEGTETEWTDAKDTDPSDSPYDIVLDMSGDDDRVVVFSSGPAPKASGRTDNDRYVARVLASDGSPDATFSDDGVFSIDFADANLSDSARRGLVLDDGSVVSSGYTVLGDARHHIFLLHLDSSGEPVEDFGFSGTDACGDAQDGVICSNPFVEDVGFAEAYSVARQSDGRLVTTGYGAPTETSSGAPDVVSFRFDMTEMDSTFAGVGALIVNSGDEDRGRDIVALADDRLVHVGKHSGVAAIYVTNADGTLYEDFGDNGIRTYPTLDANIRGVAHRDGLVAAVSDSDDDTGPMLILLEVGD